MPAALVSITRRIEFDAGHRIPDHKSKCRNAHGHRYVLEATLRGEVIEQVGVSDNGMVLDFGDLKEMMTRLIGDRWDHAFLVWKNDSPMRQALRCLDIEGLGSVSTHKTIVLDAIPTVENLVLIVAMVLQAEISMSDAIAHRNLQPRRNRKLERVVLWETPNCRAEWVNPDFRVG